MSYYAKDCIFLFLIGLIPSLFVKGGVFAWAIICFSRYLWIKMKWDEMERSRPKTKEEWDKIGKEKGFKISDHFFDEDGNFKPPRY